MNVYWIWWIAATLLIGAELLSGTFYLRAIGLSVALGAWQHGSARAPRRSSTSPRS